jgi:large subunit ribosomal protein L4
VNLLKALKVDGKKVLLLTSETNETVYKSGRNIPKIKILEAGKASAYDILNNQVLLLQKTAVDVLSKSFETRVQEEADA